MTAKQEVIQAQLTARAVVWDIPDRENIDADRLWQEMECYKVGWICVSEYGEAGYLENRSGKSIKKRWNTLRRPGLWKMRHCW